LSSLTEALDRVYGRLVAAAPSNQGEPAGPAPGRPDDKLMRLQEMFGLSAFEHDVLVLCVGAGIDTRFPRVCAAIHGDVQATWPTFGLALATLADPHWSAMSVTHPLRHWGLIELTRTGGRAPILHAPLQIDERILHYLLGVPATDERLEAFIRPLPLIEGTPRSEGNARLRALLELGIGHWRNPQQGSGPLLLCGDRSGSREAAFGELCRKAGMLAYQLDAADLPPMPEERKTLARLWTRESALQNAALFVRGAEDELLHSLRAWLDQTSAPIAIDTPAGSRAEQLTGLRLDIPSLTSDERMAAWEGELGTLANRLNGTLERIVDYFHFDESSIRFAAARARATPMPDATDPSEMTWQICRLHGRRCLESLACRIEPKATWTELVLPEAQMSVLQQITIHMRHRAVVGQKWGFAERFSRGHGLSALFAGSSGTGKTLAAEIIARELDLDLYQIDLSALVSKYIGETEKNLRRVFDAAEESGAVLLFDECDALFGKRSEVRDSHDRYANLEVSYLLQRMETYRGVAILTTNMRHALDSAFLRRIRFIVQFPFPDAPARARIWRSIFPEMTPLDDLDFGLLSQMNVSGGIIRNIATHAAFLAVQQGAPIGSRHVLAASRIEYAKLDRPLTPAETRGWS
jgi:hypothetical protein